MLIASTAAIQRIVVSDNMAHTTLILSNGFELKAAPVGFSWTVLFFSGIPALMRQDWVWGIGLILANIATYGLSSLCMAFFYNKIYAKKLIFSGYKVTSYPPEFAKESFTTYLGMTKLPE